MANGVRYVGTRAGGPAAVVKRVDDLPEEPLGVRPGLGVPGTDGFDWGTSGQGAAQLALSLCADVLGDDHALAVYHKFKTAVVAHIRGDGFVITAAAIDEWAKSLDETHRVAVIPPSGMQFIALPPHGDDGEAEE